jgi:orotate phosphoribosyltransferase
VPLHLATVDSGGRADGLLGAPPPAGNRVLLVNDVVTTGEGLGALARVVAAHDGEVAGAGWFISRDHIDVEAQLGVPSYGVATVDLPSWSPADCVLCAAAEPLRPGLDLN